MMAYLLGDSLIMLYNNISEAIGTTPLVRLHRVSQDLECTVWAKCEFMNPGGSMKDRVAKHMVEQAEKEGIIQPGDTLVEASSGNTGIGLAMMGASKGYKVVIVMPEKMSQEKATILEALGAEIIRTPSDAAFDDERSHIEVAKKLATQPRTFYLDQYNNPYNPLAHQSQTAQEIYNDLIGKVDMIVMGVGTGGSVTGISNYFKEHCPECISVGVDPYGSILAPIPDTVRPYHVEGIGYDFFPSVLNRDNVKQWIKTTDKESFHYARLLIKDEGLLCGGSSGAVLAAALKAAKALKKDQNCVLVLPDGIRNYLSKFVNPKWLQEHNLL